MRFVIVLTVLVLFRYFHLGYLFQRFHWFKDYLQGVKGYVSYLKIEQSYVGVLMYLLPLWVVVAIFYALVHHVFFDFVGFIFSFLILLYCVDPENRLKEIFQHQSESNDKNLALMSVSKLVLFSFRGYFSVCFWFIILGPLAALFYRIIERITAVHFEEQNVLIQKSAEVILNILDWIPARIFSLGFALMGHFLPGFDFWVRHFFHADLANEALIEQTAKISLSLPTDLNEEYPETIIALIDRTFVLFLVVLALIVVGRFI